MFPSESDAAHLTSTPPSAAPDVGATTLEQEIANALDGLDMNQVAAMPLPASPTAQYKAGDLVKASVLQVSPKDVLVDIGGKTQGLVSRDEFMPGYEPPAGTEFTLEIEGTDAQSGLLKLSKKKADVAVMWRDLKVGDEVDGIVVGMNKGGLEVAIKGVIRGFIPASQVDTKFLKDISELFGQQVRCEVTKIEAGEENLVLSRRKVLEREAVAAKERMFGEIKEGDVRRGKIRNVMDYGVFVDIGGVDGLLHVSDMSWSRVEKPADLVKAGDEIEVVILKLAKDKGKISLGLKQLRPNPWDSISERFSKGMTVKGRVTRHAEFGGVFVEVEPGVEGLVGLSDLSWSRRVRHAKEVCQPGDIVDVAVVSVEQDKHRMGLSIKHVSEDPWARVEEKYPVGSKLNVKVVRFAEFGAFVEIVPGCEAMIHISELSDKHVKSVSDVLKVDQELEARVLRVDPANHKIALSIKPEPIPSADAPAAPAAAAADAKPAAPKKPSKPRRGGIDFSWDTFGSKLDPSKFAQG